MIATKTMLTVLLLAGCASALVLASGCGKKEADAKVIATVGEREITAAQFDAYLKHKRIPSDNAAARKRALDEFLEREALADAIEQQALLDKEQLAAELNEMRKEMLISRYFEKFLADKASDKAIEGFYTNHAGEYEEKKVHAAHILFRTHRKMSDEERQAKLTAAQDAYSKLKAGADFAELAREVSEDKVSGKNGGDLGWLKAGSLDPKFSKVAFGLEKDALSEPFETQFGFHIVKVIEPAQTAKKPLRAVQGDIRYQLRAEAKKAELDRLEKLVKVERKGGAEDEQADKGTKTETEKVAEKSK